MRRLYAACLLSLLTLSATAAGTVDYATINRIIDEGFNHSELPQTAEYLTDRIGGRVTNSPQMRAAEKRTQAQYRSWGLANIHTEGFDFGRGWFIESSSARLMSPRALTLRAIPVAWTPPTAGTLSAGIIVAPMKRERDFSKWKGQLRGKIVLISKPGEGSHPDKAPFVRLSAEELAKLDAYEPPQYSAVKVARELKRALFDRQLDAFLAADGAADNGGGSVAVIGAARILAKLGLKPRRTIRFALWSAEEQALGGSMAYVERHFATRPPLKDPDKAGINPFYTWNTRWPITPLRGTEEIAAYFNLDNGSGKVRGIYAEGNRAVVPMFREWLEPFASMGARLVSAQHTSGTDHEFMQQVGVPGFQFIQDPLDYETRIHHSSLDTYDHLQMDDLKQSAVILASMHWLSSQAQAALPRAPVPVPRRPVDSNPFAHDDVDDEDAETD